MSSFTTHRVNFFFLVLGSDITHFLGLGPLQLAAKQVVEFRSQSVQQFEDGAIISMGVVAPMDILCEEKSVETFFCIQILQSSICSPILAPWVDRSGSGLQVALVAMTTCDSLWMGCVGYRL